MGIVVDKAIERVSALAGRRFHWTEWRTCAEVLGLYVIEDLPLHGPAYILEKCIALRHGLTEYAKAVVAWEEIGHYLTCVGNRSFWLASLPGMQGRLNLSRFERRARDVAMQLPQWDEHCELTA